MAAPQTLLRPQSVGVNFAVRSSEISYANGDTLTLKMLSINVHGQSDILDATGELDDFVTLLGTNRITGEVEINGAVVSGRMVGFNNLPDEDVKFVFLYGGHSSTSHQITVRLAITSLSLQWSRKSSFVPVKIRGRISYNTGQADQIREGAGL